MATARGGDDGSSVMASLPQPQARARRPSFPLAVVATLCLVLASPAPVGAAEPAGYEHFHTYAEVSAELDAAVADHPGIVSKFSIGQSHQGREIWAVKISDNVGVDEDEPEVFFDGLIHARERLSNEMAMYIIEMLTDGYGVDARITEIVDSREIWVVPMANPDGAEYDIANGTFHKWRKNRQPIPGSTYVGVDLNRQFGFKWACCGGGSNKPSSDTYRGPSPWYAPEVRAYRDFIDSRVVGGRQQIRALISWHTAGRLVLWPYAYTRADVPKTMSKADWRAFVALGRQMAALNGYRAEQGSDLYIVDGDQDDWAYNEHRIFAYTFEMARGALKRYYPTAAEVASELAKNRAAVLLLLEQADCPYRAAGLGATHCGPLNDDFETGRGWSFAGGSGAFERGDPRRTATGAGVKQRGGVPSGLSALVTGALGGGSANANDVDGLTTATSPTIHLGSGPWTLRLRYTFAHNAAATSADYLRVSVVAGGTTTPVWTLLGKPSERNARWRTKKLSLSAWAGQDVRLLIEANDGGADNIVEAALDDMRIYRTP